MSKEHEEGLRELASAARELVTVMRELAAAARQFRLAIGPEAPERPPPSCPRCGDPEPETHVCRRDGGR
jgi:hypothetical protein